MFKSIKNNQSKRLTSMALAVAMMASILSPATLNKVKAADSKIIHIVNITDFHGQLLDSKNNQVGAALAKAVKDIRKSNVDRTLVIGGGDFYQGSPVSNVLKGVPVQNTFTNLGMEFTALGNHEFDWGLNTIDNETMKGASYKILCANMTKKGTTETLYEPYKVTVKDGVRIAVIGAMSEETPTIVLPANIKDYEVTDMATAVNKYAKEIKSGNLADVIIATVHEGGDALPKFVSKLSGVNAVFGGHSHSKLDTVVKDADNKDVPTIIAKNNGQAYVDLQMTVNADKTVSFSKDNYKELKMDATTPIDSEVKTIVDEAYKNLAPTFDEVIGKTTKNFTKDQSDQPYGESQLGNWMADVVKAKGEAEVGVVNNGGIRLSPIVAGDIKVGTIFNLMPFDNTICTVKMTGAQLKILLEQALQDNGKGIQVSGIKFTYDMSKQGYVPADTKTGKQEVMGQRIVKLTKEDGTAIKDTDTIKVAAPDFLATGGDTFTVFVDYKNIKDTFEDLSLTKGQDYLVRNALISDVRAKKTIAATLGNRIVNGSGSGNISGKEMSIFEARKQSEKTEVTVTGVVTTVDGSNKFIQDDTAGICVFTKENYNVGDMVKVSGPITIYSGLYEIKPTAYKVVSSGNKVNPVSITIDKINASYEGQLIQLRNVKINSIDNSGASNISDATGNIDIYKMAKLNGVNVGDRVDLTAAVSQFKGKYQLSVPSADLVKLHDDTAKVDIAVLTSTDLHNRMLPWDYATDSGITTTKADKTVVNTGSFAQVATMVRQERKNNKNVILIDNGDTVQDNAASLFLDKAKYPVHPMLQGMNALGYDAWVLGNHEFNYGMDKVKDFRSNL